MVCASDVYITREYTGIMMPYNPVWSGPDKGVLRKWDNFWWRPDFGGGHF